MRTCLLRKDSRPVNQRGCLRFPMLMSIAHESITFFLLIVLAEFTIRFFLVNYLIMLPEVLKTPGSTCLSRKKCSVLHGNMYTVNVK